MSRSISLFANYHQGENTLTNYCGLMLKLIYESSPRKFEKLLANLFPNSNLTIGPSFSQQEKQQKSIPDLTIRQRSFSIYFENKLSDWFHLDQLKNHADGLLQEKSETTLLVLLSSDFNIHSSELNQLEIELKKYNIDLYQVTYQDFCTCLEEVCTNDFLKDVLEAFEEYLERDVMSGMTKTNVSVAPLQDWRSRMDVVNCHGTYEEAKNGFFICAPGDVNRAYRHKRSRVFGAYNEKTVSMLFNIIGVTIVPQNSKTKDDVSILWNNALGTVTDDELKQNALDIINQHRQGQLQNSDFQVFILDNQKETDFVKDSDGGMYASKQYYTIDPEISVEELANHLTGKQWSNYPNKIIK